MESKKKTKYCAFWENRQTTQKTKDLLVMCFCYVTYALFALVRPAVVDAIPTSDWLTSILTFEKLSANVGVMG